MADEEGTLAVAIYDFEPLRDDHLRFKAGDVLLVMEMNENGWWKGSDAEGRVGEFPYNYVELRDGVGASFPVCKALFDYAGVNDGDLTFQEGDLVTLIRELNADWWVGRLKSGEEGTFPSAYVERTELEDVEAAKAEKKRWSSMRKDAQRALKDAEKEKKALEKKLAKEKAEAEEKERLLEEARAAAERARVAEEELARVKAETARLKRMEEERKARRSQRASMRVAAGQARVRAKADSVAKRFDGFSPGPAPPPKASTYDDDDDFFGKPADEPPVPPRKTGRSTAASSKAISEADAEEDADSAANAEAEVVAEAPPRETKFKYNAKFANLGGGSRCATCGKIVGFADKVKALGKEYHTNCFRCSTCSVVLRQGEWRGHGEFPYCHKCHAQGFGIKGFGFGGSVVPVSAGSGPPEAEVDDAPLFDSLKTSST
ncbi:SH3 domain-containing kinase-binding protein 1 [Hondaea fermentalgiana]|uniref:SH3 domain-containing kinase-binding protein 1 n=1 Tax=Hondaea fermentalgiana TaxID=2315210 RepID=A0A2R5GEL5_9STRA|nr:SH3 domain-containing kinase-binding protein 1 [Hondaea fermentalgiana]|eukprot:GBG27053.1 SH3 domain-containing kinase-binding protein 1 [Hondaea fermentalgiana]